MNNYKALYRKYRPQTFSDVVDQEHVTRTLKNSIKLGHISHAYLFNGPRGVGKTTIARVFAKAINCLNPNGEEPCGECEVCKSIVNGSNPDIIEIDAASRTRVEQMRDTLEKTSFLPTMSKYKVYIIDEIHMLSSNSFNALLKTLEEPPAHVIFILCTTEVEKVIPTIRSRCQRFDFHLIDKDAMVSHLIDVSKEEDINISEEAISLIAESAEGGMRDALSLLDQVSSFSLSDEITKEDVLMISGRLSTSTLTEIAWSVYKNNSTETINLIDSVIKLGKEVERITQDLISFYKDILVIKNTNRDLKKSGYELDEFKMLVKEISNDSVYGYIEDLTNAMTNYRFTTNKKLYFELALIKMCGRKDRQPSFERKEIEEKYDPTKVYTNPFLEKKTEDVKPIEEPKVVEEPKTVETKEETTETELETIIEVPEVQITEETQENEELPLNEEDNSSELEVPEIKESTQEEIVNDEESEYDIHFVEEILNNSDKPFKEEIIEKLSTSSKLTKGTALHKFSLMLEGSSVVASSRGAFILTFPVVGQCNLVMKEENVKGIVELIKLSTGSDLSYIALPQDLWSKLAKEYVNIYRSNAISGKNEYIKLTKIPCPGLNIGKEKKKVEHDNKYKDLEDLFGEDFIKVK